MKSEEFLLFSLADHMWVPKEFGNPNEAIRVYGKWHLIRPNSPPLPKFPALPECPDEILRWTDEEEREKFSEYVRGGRTLKDQLFLRAQQSKLAMVAMEVEMLLSIDHVIKLASNGNIGAAECLVLMAEKCCSALTGIAMDGKRRSVLIPVAEKRTQWPVLRSEQPMLSDDWAMVSRGIKLGSKSPLKLKKTAKWKAHDLAGQITLKLFRYLHWYPNSAGQVRGEFGNIISATKSLPPLSHQSVDEWWNVAKSLLLFSYPKPENIDELKALAKGKSKQRNPSTIRQSIFDTIERRFKSAVQ